MRTTPDPHHDTKHPAPDVGRLIPEVPAHIVAALGALDDAYNAAAALPHRSNVEHAERALCLARVCARRAAWWRVLARFTYRAGLHPLHGKAVVISAGTERDRARFWRDSAADWRARADRVLTSDTAGALSNWHELGVTA
ncbi:hypothetical protein [Pseudonocardia abyssalis]|uniref:DUF222 domain-containing protein n=1 Tax=Pseudonocardia abyssalis TaxID=2792008 RepID=A0ABS6UXQ9_9PSEU|nr:hypothetical protein [Pseudonocardia abyssalis]MBW0113915.1 hypothetical protein [Pseudonocardia abyssalis]MBW0137001.1 hypothetical protein [Pseudonocardia abyssalis]